MNKELKIAYLAGVLDSDGWFTIHKNTLSSANPIYSPKVGINQCEGAAIKLAQELYGGKISVIDYTQQDRFSPKPMFHWSSIADTIEVMLTELIPHLRIKVKQAEVLLRLVKDIRVNRRGGKNNPHPQFVVSFRESLYQELRQYNHPSVAETECVDLVELNKDATVRTEQMENVQSKAEMSLPALV